jgi:agmatine/peptidylarginine deiminase
MITDKETNLVYFSSLISTKDEYRNFWKKLEPILIENNIDYKLLENTRDIWCRDYMPIQISENKFIEYKYDPDYLQAKKYRHLKTYTDIICEQINLQTSKTDLIIDGGNVIKSNNCVILTEKVIIENKPIYKQEETIEKIKKLFEVEKVIIIPWDNDEFYGHADGMIRFLDNKTVLLNWYIELEDCEYKQKLLNILQENGISWKFLNINAKDENKDYNWAYINFLQTNEVILLPIFGIMEDKQAFEEFKQIFPDYDKKEKIIQIDCSEIVKNQGALNCITWNIKK